MDKGGVLLRRLPERNSKKPPEEKEKLFLLNIFFFKRMILKQSVEGRKALWGHRHRQYEIFFTKIEC